MTNTRVQHANAGHHWVIHPSEQSCWREWSGWGMWEAHRGFCGWHVFYPCSWCLSLVSFLLVLDPRLTLHRIGVDKCQSPWWQQGCCCKLGTTGPDALYPLHPHFCCCNKSSWTLSEQSSLLPAPCHPTFCEGPMWSSWSEFQSLFFSLFSKLQ